MFRESLVERRGCVAFVFPGPKRGPGLIPPMSTCRLFYIHLTQPHKGERSARKSGITQQKAPRRNQTCVLLRAKHVASNHQPFTVRST